MAAPCGRTSVVAIVWMLACVRAAIAQAPWEPPSISDGPQLPPIAVPSDLIPALRIGSVDVLLNRTPLAAVARQFEARIGRRGDANDALGWICLTGRDAGGRWVLWLESGEIHGGAIGAFQLRRIGAAERIDSRCVSSRADIRTLAAVRLGMSRADVKRLLGEFSGTPAMVSYLYEHPGPADSTIEALLSMLFAGDTLTAFEVWRTETK